ncbi:Stk1 family PASTA domain-containing Ser/Thr kinase [Virgibacillus ndiopensis]|uniref:Stk1 family PASTA domain-containing Ser/Thr kinase n=1 Tax=Virgibacillus ndiopensis TaxID=2004408 RepID=UPI000C077865|nr:Stk1 family PASTA domain-containing Ser/Thr kinase [Virgibacillus ndiopensis]
MLNGHLLNERYQIKETIGGGGMANVYLAKDTILDRDVAIKVLRLEYANDEEFIARFDREAQSATSLSHPNIVNIYDVGEEDHYLYMVMEYVDGMTLKEYIQKYGPIDVQESLDIMKQISSAIAHAHANDIVHRDIKPQNILIDTYGQVKVTDFGIAVALSATSLTQTNSILGSVHYLSPEQARGGMATKKSDIYSLGIVLFELLTARLPFSGQSPVSIALKHLQNDTPSVRRFNQDVPQSVENIVLKATAKDPFHRYETVYEMEDALETALDPSKLDEQKYTPPVEIGEETKAIPIITDSQMQQHTNQNTIVHHTNGNTQKYQSDNQDEKPMKNKKKKGKGKDKKKKSKKKKWIIILVVLFMLIATGITALFVVPELLQPDEVDVPDVANMEYEDAVNEIESVKLKPEKEQIYSEDVEEGIVVKTNPRFGKTVKEGSTVTVYVSQGKEKVAFPDYLGDDFSQVERLLEEAGYDEIIPIEKFSDKQVGEIITQIQPAPETEVIPSETKVIFEISKGPELVSLDNLEGMTEAEAKDYLESNNLKMNAIEENSEDAPNGEVFRQDPGPNAELEEGSTVDVYISIGPEEKPPRSHSVTFTVPYKEPEQPDQPDDQQDQQQEDDQQVPKEQTVRIYVKDANNDLSDVFKEDKITEDKDYTITLTIPPGETAQYKVMRDDETIIDKKVPYKEGE